MAFPTTSILSTFNGVDESPLSEGGNWLGPIRVSGPPSRPRRVSNVVGNATAGQSTSETYWTPSTFGPDSEAYADITALPTANNHFFGLCTRIQVPNTAGNDFYALEVLRVSATSYSFDLYRVINGVFSANLGPFTSGVNPSAGEQWGFSAVDGFGNVTLNAWRNTGSGWQQLGSTIEDANAARITSAGNVGFYIGGATSSAWRIDNFGGGTVVPAAVALASDTPPIIMGRGAA